jgi:hypothetical protein
MGPVPSGDRLGDEECCSAHQRLTRVRLPGSHLTASRSPFSRLVHHLGSYPHAAPSDPCGRPVLWSSLHVSTIYRDSARDRNQFSSGRSTRNPLLKPSTKTFCIGLPGSMKSRVTPASRDLR